MEEVYLKIIKDKNGEWDFGVTGNMEKVTREDAKNFRSMLVSAIYIAEDMMRRSWEKSDGCKCLIIK